jgi:hypothetical protein
MGKVSNTAEHEQLYVAKAGAPALVDIPPARFLAVDGAGSPDDEAFQEAIAALYAIAFTAKFALKKSGGENVTVPPLEGLFTDFEASSFDEGRWRLVWTLMLRLPKPFDDALIERARADAARRRPLPALDRVHTMQFAEGTCAQVLHIGPYSTEPPTIELLREFIRSQQLQPRGRHHEIYLGDPRRARPETLKTILRQPVG